MHEKPRLDPLTALRFFAAALIVLGHAEDLFAITGITPYAPFNQGVSFFFILSGFILTWNYPALTDWSQRRQFWLARFARVWPLHLVTCLLWIALVYEFDRTIHFPGTDGLLKLATNLLLVQAWIPSHAWELSFNGVAWSISVEFFFYLMFPLLIVFWKKHWHQIILLEAAVLAFLVVLAANSSIGIPQLLYFHPLSRLLEFTIGIGLAFGIIHVSATNFRLSKSQWFTLELLVIWLTVVAMLVAGNPYGLKQSLGEAAVYQFKAAGLWPIWALVIGLFALSKGPIASALSTRFAVFLGEISFSLYLCHALVIHYLMTHREMVAGTGWFGYVLFWIFCLFLSALLYQGIETPARKLILAKPNSLSIGKTITATFRTKETVSLAALLCVASVMYFFKPSTITALTPPVISAFLHNVPETIELPTPAVFDERYDLLALRITPSTPETFQVQVLMRARQPLRATDTLALHVNGENSAMMANFDRKLDYGRHTLPSGTTWLQTYQVPKSAMTGSKSLGFAMYTDPRLLYNVAGAQSDWGGKRLIVPFKIDPQ